MAAVTDLSPVAGGLTAGWGVRERIVRCGHTVSLHDRTVSLPAHSFFRRVTPCSAYRYTGTGRHRAMRRRMAAKSRLGIATSAI